MKKTLIFVMLLSILLPVFPAISEEARILTIIGAADIPGGDGGRLEKAKEIFEAENPGYTVVFKETPKPDAMMKATMANREGYDILVLDSTNMLEYKKTDVLCDLSANKAIAENFSQYLDMPFLWERDGSLYGVPIHATPLSFVITQSAKQTFDIDIPAEWTWEDIFALSDFAVEEELLLINGMMEWEAVRRQYACKYGADYTTDTFRNLVEGWKALSDAKLVSIGNDERTLFGLQSHFWCGDFGLLKASVFLNFPLLDGEHVTPIDMTGLYVNKYSENADAAVRFLEIYSSKEVQKEYRDGRNGLFLPDFTEYACYDLWSRFNNYLPEKEEFEKYKSALATGYLIQIDQKFEWVERQLFRQFAKEELTIDEFIAALQEQADLMIGE